jgi:Terminase large subunit, T4likevirus-type, N-terminal
MIRTVSLACRMQRLEAQAHAVRRRLEGVLDQVRSAPAGVMRLAGLEPDAWQEALLASTARQVLMLCSRQSGKSSVAAALALRTALLNPGSPTLLLSPSLRQSGELFRKVLELYDVLKRPLPALTRTALRLEFANGSRILSLPGTEATVRGFSGVALLVIDEAARVMDPLYYAVRPMLAVSQGRLVALSTPFGKRGWFHDEWHGAGEWERVRITAEQCPRISKEFLAEERRALGERWYRQEFCCSFEDTIDAVFAWEDIQAAMSDAVKPLFGS